ncbi:hypothetical protein GW915_00115 [bacterium]|nr:hypothetical protein [bacterium]
MTAFKKLFCLSVFLFSLASQALTVSYMPGSGGRGQKIPTHIFVIGYAGGLGDQLFKSAVSRARRYRELYPKHQIAFIGPDKLDESLSSYDSYAEYRSALSRFGLELEHMDDKWLLSNRLMPLLKSFKQIQSIDIFSHSAAHLGVGLEDIPSSSSYYKYKRFNYLTEGLSSLKSHFLSGAYIMLHGCNSGFTQAPKMAALLGIPVAGSLSSTNTQELFSDDSWYFNDSGRYPRGVSRSSYNSSSFASGRFSCSSGHCHRMRPEAYPYVGGWGRLTAGLTHYKFFCGTAEASSACKQTMALALLGHPGVNSRAAYDLSAFKENVKEFLCPDSNRASAKKECFEKMEASLTDPTVSYAGLLSGKPVRCDFAGCDVKISCGRKCSITHVGANPQPRTMQNEFRAYVEGFRLLQR